MHRTSIEGVGLAALIAGLAMTGCVHTKAEEGPSNSLVHARAMDEAVSRAGIASLVPAEVNLARSLLMNAEEEHKENPRSNMEKHLSALASSKFEIAIAEAHRLRTVKELAQAGSKAGAGTAELEAERAARIKAEQEAQAARDRLEQSGVLRETEEGTVVTLNGQVLFKFDQSELLPIAKDRLKEVADAFKGTEGAILIQGYTDAVGTETYNKELSERRAKAVKDYLSELGMEPERIRTEGFGEKDPIATNKTPEGRANNRRVEIVVEPQA